MCATSAISVAGGVKILAKKMDEYYTFSNQFGGFIQVKLFFVWLVDLAQVKIGVISSLPPIVQKLS